MAITGGFRFGVKTDDVFPNGCVMGADPVVVVTDFEKRGKGDDQERDKQNPDLRVWAVRVHDLDESLVGKSREIVVKISAPVCPTPPVGPFQAVEFEGLTVTPWLEEKLMGRDKNGNERKKSVLKFSFRASGFKDTRKPAPAASSSKSAGGQ